MSNLSSPEDTDDAQIEIEEEHEDDSNMIQSVDASNRLEMVRELDMQYKHLIEKYEALLHLHHEGSAREELPQLNHSMSLQEELKMSGQFDNIPKFDNDSSGDGNNIEMDHQLFESGPMSLILMPEKPNKPFCGRLTSSAMSKTEEFSEAETYSSGFSEERAEFKCSNKTTQTEEEPEQNLCENEDLALNEPFGHANPFEKDTKVSLVNLNQSTNPVDQHFPTTPAYKDIFKEIFCVLKKAHEDAPKINPEVIIPPLVTKKILRQKRPSAKEECASKAKMEIKMTKDLHWDISDYPSLASASVARLINLEETYANVLRKGIIPFGE